MGIFFCFEVDQQRKLGTRMTSKQATTKEKHESKGNTWAGDLPHQVTTQVQCSDYDAAKKNPTKLTLTD